MTTSEISKRVSKLEETVREVGRQSGAFGSTVLFVMLQMQLEEISKQLSVLNERLSFSHVEKLPFELTTAPVRQEFDTGTFPGFGDIHKTKIWCARKDGANGNVLAGNSYEFVSHSTDLVDPSKDVVIVRPLGEAQTISFSLPEFIDIFGNAKDLT